MSDYHVFEQKHGATVVGDVPLAELEDLAIDFEARGLTHLDGAIAQHLGVTLCAVSRESGAAWRAELGIE